MLTAFIAAQLIGVRREVVELNASQRKTYQDDLNVAYTLFLAGVMVIGPFIWPVGMAFSKPFKKHPWLYGPYIIGVIIVIALGLWFYIFVGFFWALYEVLAFSAKRDEAEREKQENFRKKISNMFQEPEEDQYDDVVYVDEKIDFECPCGCGYSEKITKLKSRVNPEQ